MSTSPNIVLVDDNRDDIEVALRAARREGLRVEITVFHDGREVLDALGVNGDSAPKEARLHPQAIFLDLRMPRIDGWEVLRRLREAPHTRKIPVIVQSWSTRKEDIDRCYALGANGFVPKRLTPEKPGFYFTDAIRSWVVIGQDPD